MKRVIGLRLGSTAILGEEAVHDVDNDFLSDGWVRINLGKAAATKARALGETPPVVDVWERGVVKTTGDAVHLAVAHHRDVNDLRNVASQDFRKMTEVAGIFRIRQGSHLPEIGSILKISPHQLA